MNKRAIFIDRGPYDQIARFLEQEHGWDVSGIATGLRTKPMPGFYSEYLDLYGVIQRAKTSPIPDDIIARCQRIEDEYDVNLADVLASDRHLGIAWSTGGLYPRSRLSYMPYERHLHIIYEVFQSFSEFVRRVKPAFVCFGTVGAFVGAIAFLVGNRYKIPTFGLARAAHNMYYWQMERYGLIPGLERAYRKLQSSQARPTDNEPWDVASFNSEMGRSVIASRRWPNFLRKLFRVTYPLLLVKILGRNRKIGDIYLSKMIKYMVRGHLNFKKSMRRSYTPFEEIARSDYVYFPLTTEPEAALMGLEPHFTNQMYAIELLSKSVPVGVTVVVKEHWNAVGNQPANWRDTVADFPRVRLVHPFENSIGIIRNSLATATITGTSGMEAAILGRPVISLGPNYRFAFVDNVYFGRDLSVLRRIIKGICENSNSEDLMRSGMALKRAIETTTFILEATGIGNIRLSSDVATACEELLKLVNVPQTAEQSSPTDGVANPSPFDA